jgi:Spy/CpxP family protein refolding chaperone
MKTKVLMFVAVMSISVALVAQPAGWNQKKSFREADRTVRMNNEQRGMANGLNLTAEQKNAFKQSILAMQKQLQPIRNELGEAEARQKTLTTAEKPDLTAINKNIEKIGALKVEMAKIQAKYRLDIRAQLTDEQRLKFDMHRGKMDRAGGPGAMQHKLRRERLVN